MLPYFFVGNKTNYARWTPVYLMDMMNLPDDIQEEFMSGKFAIKQTAGSSSRFIAVGLFSSWSFLLTTTTLTLFSLLMKTWQEYVW
jgi:hypothetical protein